jgi:hypothetical protein
MPAKSAKAASFIWVDSLGYPLAVKRVRPMKDSPAIATRYEKRGHNFLAFMLGGSNYVTAPPNSAGHT